MENTSDYLMLGLLLICMKYDKKVCYKVLDNNLRRTQITPTSTIILLESNLAKRRLEILSIQMCCISIYI